MADFNASEFNSSVGDFGTAVGDLYAAGGFRSEAKTYGQAAELENQNVSLEKSSVAIQQAQAERKIYQSFSATKGAAGGAGLAESGSIGDILRSSAQQGALTHQLIGEQGQINENAYAAQAGAYQGQQTAADKAAKGSGAAGYLSTIEGIAGMAALFL